MSRAFKCNLFAFLTVLMWSVTFPMTREMSGYLSANTIALLRCAVASIALLVIWLFRKDRKAPTKKNLIWFVLSGASGFGLYLVCFNMGLSTITSAESSVIIAMTPILVAIASTFIYKEHMTLTGWLTTFGAFVGVVVLMTWDSGFDIKAGMLWTFGASVLFTCYNLINRRLSGEGYSSIDIVTFGMFFATLILIWALPVTISDIAAGAPASALIACVFMGIFPSACAYACWGVAMNHANKTSDVTNYMFVTPLLATILAMFMLHEMPTFGTCLGGAIIISMLVIFNVTKGRE